MAELDRRYAGSSTVGRAEPGVIDQGLRAYMLRVYNYMASGVAITGVVAYLTYMFAVVDTGNSIGERRCCEPAQGRIRRRSIHPKRE